MRISPEPHDLNTFAFCHCHKPIVPKYQIGEDRNISGLLDTRMRVNIWRLCIPLAEICAPIRGICKVFQEGWKRGFGPSLRKLC